MTALLAKGGGRGSMRGGGLDYWRGEGGVGKKVVMEIEWN